MAHGLHTYRAIIERWVDGDTVELRVDLGFNTWHEGTFRLAGINTPERGRDGWAEATAAANSAAPVGTEVTASVGKPDKYGRWLVTLLMDGDEDTLNQQLIDAGYAKPYRTH